MSHDNKMKTMNPENQDCETLAKRLSMECADECSLILSDSGAALKHSEKVELSQAIIDQLHLKELLEVEMELRLALPFIVARGLVKRGTLLAHPKTFATKALESLDKARKGEG